MKKRKKKNSNSAKILKEEKKPRNMRICDTIYISLKRISNEKGKSICFISEEAYLDYIKKHNKKLKK